MGIKALRVFGYVWLVLAVLLILVGIAGVWMKEGFGGVQELLSPFNLANWFVTASTVAPGIAALVWADKLAARRRRAALAAGAQRPGPVRHVVEAHQSAAARALRPDPVSVVGVHRAPPTAAGTGRLPHRGPRHLHPSVSLLEWALLQGLTHPEKESAIVGPARPGAPYFFVTLSLA
jgi:hypothetical protein